MVISFDSMFLSSPDLKGIVPTMKVYNPATEPPALYKLAAELRVTIEAPIFLSVPWNKLPVPKGDRHPVMLLPGFCTHDVTLQPLASKLTKLGYRAQTWGEGINFGTTPQLFDRLLEKVITLRTESDMQVSLIGWSLGGIMARKMAAMRPDLFRRVIMMGSPIHGSAEATRVGTLMAAVRKLKGTTIIRQSGTPREPRECKVPVVSLFNRNDAIANWKNCIEINAASAENIHVAASHFGFGANPFVMQILTDRLAQPRSGFHPYEPPIFTDAFIQTVDPGA